MGALSESISIPSSRPYKTVRGRAALPARDFVGKDDFLLTYGDILVRPETYHQMVQRFSTAAFDGLLTVTEGKM